MSFSTLLRPTSSLPFVVFDTPRLSKSIAAEIGIGFPKDVTTMQYDVQINFRDVEIGSEPILVEFAIIIVITAKDHLIK
jgi:hypothetical protein